MTHPYLESPPKVNTPITPNFNQALQLVLYILENLAKPNESNLIKAKMAFDNLQSLRLNKLSPIEQITIGFIEPNLLKLLKG